MATKKYLCKTCGYVHEGDTPPTVCPVCKVGVSEFELQAQPKKGMLADKNSNAYIIIYSTVMVVVVAFLLAFTALSLKDRQAKNVLNEKKSAILLSLGAEDQDYDKFIEAIAVDAEGNIVEDMTEDDVIKMLDDLKSTFAGDIYPIFKAKDGRVVVPVFGNGLWNIIWGYVALESDMNTISGVVLDHAGETPGLGAEIATPKHQAMYKGKTIFNGEEFVAVKLMKGGATNPEHEVDAITGGTKTSDGVSAMLFDSLEKYVAYFNKMHADASDVEVEEVEIVLDNDDMPAEQAEVESNSVNE